MWTRNYILLIANPSSLAQNGYKGLKGGEAKTKLRSLQEGKKRQWARCALDRWIVRMSATAVTFSLFVSDKQQFEFESVHRNRLHLASPMMDRISKFLLLWLGLSTRQWLIQHLTGSQHPCARLTIPSVTATVKISKQIPLIRFENRNCWHFFIVKKYKEMHVFIFLVMFFLLRLHILIGKLTYFPVRFRPYDKFEVLGVFNLRSVSAYFHLFVPLYSISEKSWSIMNVDIQVLESRNEGLFWNWKKTKSLISNCATDN